MIFLLLIRYILISFVVIRLVMISFVCAPKYLQDVKVEKTARLTVLFTFFS